MILFLLAIAQPFFNNNYSPFLSVKPRVCVFAFLIAISMMIHSRASHELQHNFLKVISAGNDVTSSYQETLTSLTHGTSDTHTHKLLKGLYPSQNDDDDKRKRKGNFKNGN